MNKLPITIIVLTYNEEKDIAKCLGSLAGWVETVYVVDSFSTDRTLAVAREYGAEVVQHAFENYAKQFNWALDNLPIKTEWVMRLDADEYVSNELREELTERLSSFDEDVSGLVLRFRNYFMGKWLRYGSLYPIWLLRIWRNGKCRCEERWMDEHMKITEGRISLLNSDFIHDNRKDLTWWTGKHNSYATREAIDLLDLQYQILKSDRIMPDITGRQAQRKRWLKEKVYARLPLFVRPFVYFIYRYFIRLGFLDGKEGLIYHFLQGFWYRFLVDAKIYEIKKKSLKDGVGLKETITKYCGLKL